MSSASGSTSIADVAIDTLKVDELRALCTERHLNSAGKKAVLLQPLRGYAEQEKNRVRATQANMPPTLESLGHGSCPAIIMGRAEIGDDGDMIESAERSPRAVLEEELVVDHAVGNRRGLGLAELPDEIRVLKSRVAGLENAAKTDRNTVSALRGQVNDLIAAKSHRALRNRFLVFYKRANLLEIPLDDFDHRCIDEGNYVVHGGDPKADAELYRGLKPRTDYIVFKELYGYQPDIVWRIDHVPTIALLNLHATVKADARRVASPKFYAFFAEFVDRFERSNFNPTYLDAGNTTLVTKAYWQFLDCVEAEVKAVTPPNPDVKR